MCSQCFFISLPFDTSFFVRWLLVSLNVLFFILAHFNHALQKLVLFILNLEPQRTNVASELLLYTVALSINSEFIYGNHINFDSLLWSIQTYRLQYYLLVFILIHLFHISAICFVIILSVLTKLENLHKFFLCYRFYCVTPLHTGASRQFKLQDYHEET